MSKFDPIAVGDKIAGYLAEADKAKGAVIEHSKVAGALLVEVAEKHPKYLESICSRIHLGRSRLNELMQIAGGRKTAEEIKANTQKRVAKCRAKAKALPNPESSVTSRCNGRCVGASTIARTSKRHHRAGHTNAGPGRMYRRDQAERRNGRSLGFGSREV